MGQKVSPSHPAIAEDHRRWNHRSAVRTRPERDALTTDEGERLFSTAEIPIAAHPLVAERFSGSRAWHELHVHHLYRFLNFTLRLEHHVVNPVLRAIGHREAPIESSLRDAHLAHRMYVDEAYHVVQAAELAYDVMAHTGIEALEASSGPIDLRLAQALAAVDDRRQHALGRLLFVTVSETMISSALARVPNDPAVAPAVRQVLAEHWHDEAQHHAFFAGFLEPFWAQLSPGDIRVLAPLLPRFLSLFVEPDWAGIEAELTAYGMTRSQAGVVLAETYSNSRLLAVAAETGQATRRHLQRCGAFENPAVEEAFTTAAFLP